MHQCDDEPTRKEKTQLEPDVECFRQLRESEVIPLSGAMWDFVVKGSNYGKTMCASEQLFDQLKERSKSKRRPGSSWESGTSA